MVVSAKPNKTIQQVSLKSDRLPYTIPQRISGQYQPPIELSGGGARTRLLSQISARTALFCPYVAGLGKHAGEQVWVENGCFPPGGGGTTPPLP